MNFKMEENDNKKLEQKVKKKKINFRLLLVSIVLLFFSIGSYVSFRAEYLKILDEKDKRLRKKSLPVTFPLSNEDKKMIDNMLVYLKLIFI